MAYLGAYPVVQPLVGADIPDGAITAPDIPDNAVTKAKISGLTSDISELNALQGVTVTVADLNTADVSTEGTSEASKIVTADSSGNISIGGSVTATNLIGDASGISNLPATAGIHNMTASGAISDGDPVVVNADGTVSTVTSSNLTAENYIGISSGSYTNGQTATIQVKGSVDDAQSGLTAGQTYYVQTDATLATTAGSPSVVAGTAISATKIIVKG